MTYDPKSGTLWSGDLFGGVSLDWSLFAKGDFLTPMRIFHEQYMPGHGSLAPAMDRVAKMRLQRILPQHGSVIGSAHVPAALDYLSTLRCGTDILYADLDE